ncbi:MAG: hypothetical protein IPL96_10010 [Holophagaceae bacterium]|nr:hypothetical protein [Holophagaceae bacterium]
MEFDVKIEVLADGKTVRTKELPHYALLFASGLAQAATKGQTYTLTLKDGRMYQNSAIKAEDLPAAQERIRASAGSLVKFTVSETGTLSGSELIASPNAVPGIANGMHDLLRQLRIMGVPLPAEPVGVGAKWVVRVEKFQAAGSQVPLSYDLNYHLKGIEENKVQIEAIAELSLPPEAMPLPFEPKMVKEAKPPYFRMKLDMEQNLEMPLPERMELSFEVGNSAKVEAEGAVHDFATRSLGFMRWVPDVPKQ